MKKIMMLVVILIVAFGCGKKEVEKKEVLNIGITQIVEHPSLDEIRNGIIDTLAKEGFVDGENIKINFQNAQGDMANAQLIAKDFAEKEDLIIAITTPSAQASLNASNTKPIFFSAVTDPVAAGLNGKNITGTSDATPIDKQLELAIEIFGELKSVGIVYNLGEANSQVQVDKVNELANKYGFEVKTIGINSVNELAQGIDALEDVSIIYTPVDNLLASGYPLIVSKAKEKNIPVLGAVTDFVQKGAFGTEGINQYKIGVQTANMIVKYLNGSANIEELPFETIEDTDLVLNTRVLEELGVEVKAELKERATLIK